MLALRWFEAARGRPQPFQSLLRTLVPPDLLPPWSPLLRQIPIWFPAARYRPGVPLAQQLAEQLYRTSQGALQAPVDLLERWLREGQCALFIDGLGQTRYGENEAALLEALERLAVETPCSILAAGTMEAVHLEGFHCFTLAPWSEAQISALLRAGKTLAALQGPVRDLDRWEALRQSLQEDPELAALASRPWWLSGLLTLALQAGGLPTRRSALYDQLIPLLLDRADPLPAEEDLPAALKMAALENLAWGLQMLRRASLPASSAEELLADLLRSDGRFEPAQARRALAWLREGCGLVTSGAALAFRHPAVQAVLVARAALSDPERRALLFRLIEDPDGHAALVMFAGLAGPPLVREFFDRLLGAEEDFFYTRTRLAGRCLIETPYVPAGIREQVLQDLRNLLTRTPFAALQEEAATILAHIPGQTEWLAEQLRRPELPTSARWFIVDALVQAQGRRAAGLLALALREDQVPEPVRERIAEHLGVLGDAELARSLSDMIGDESVSPALRCRIVAAIARIGDPSLGPVLMEQLGLPWLNAAVREAILDALRRLGSPSLPEDLVPFLRDPNLPLEHRRRIAGLLGSGFDPKHLEDLQALVEDPQLDPPVRAALLHAMAERGVRRLTPWLMGILRRNRRRWRVWAAEVFKALPAPLARILQRWGDGLLAAAEDYADLILQREAVVALGLLRDRRAVPTLLRLLWDPQTHPSLRALIPDALAAIGEPRVVPSLLAMLRDRGADPMLRERIALALGTMKATAAIPALLDLLRDPTEDPFLQARAALAIGLMREPSVAKDLVPLLRWETLPVTARRAIADALGTLGAREVVRSLIQMLPDERIPPSVRQAIAEAIGTLGPSDLGDEGLWLLHDERIDPNVRGAIALTLITLRYRPAAPEMIALLPDARIDPSIRQAIAEGLKDLWDPALIPALARLLNESALEVAVRRGIARTLGERGGPEAFVALWILARNPEAPMPLRRAAADGLLACASPEFEDALLAVALDPEIPAYIRGRALEALREVGGDRETVRALVAALHDTDMPNALFHTLMAVAHRARVRLPLQEMPPSGMGLRDTSWEAGGSSPAPT